MVQQERAALPCHATNLEIAQVTSVFLFRFSRKLGSQELNRRHCRVERVDMVLSKVTSVLHIKLKCVGRHGYPHP